MLVDENGEPRAFGHKSSPEREGAQMTEKEMLGFAVDSLTAVFEEAGLRIIATNKNPGWEYPHFIMESRNGKLYYVLVDCFAFPAEGGKYDHCDLSTYRSIARDAGAIPTIAPVGLFCFNTEGEGAICGGVFALKYATLVGV